MLDVNYLIRILNLSQKEESLLKLYISTNVTKKEVYNLLDSFDYNIEKEDFSFNFLLANLFQNNPYIEIPKDIEPRLKGVLRMFQYKNVLLLSGLQRLAVELNTQQISVLLLKDSAMKILESDNLRMMSNVDCAVFRDNFDKTVKTSVRLGFNLNVVCDNTTEVKRNPMQKIDIHRKIIKSDNDTEYTEKKIFERAKQYNFSGSNVFVPDTEDMIFLLLNNGYENIIYSKDFYKNISWLLDVVYIVNNNKFIDWNLVILTAKESKTIAQIKIMFELVNHFLPNTIPESVISSIIISNQEQNINYTYTKKHLFINKTQKLKQQARELIKSKKISDIFYIINLLSQFLYLKVIQKVPVIKSLFFDKVANRMFKI